MKLKWQFTRGGMDGAHQLLMTEDGRYVGHFYEDASDDINASELLQLLIDRFNAAETDGD